MKPGLSDALGNPPDERLLKRHNFWGSRQINLQCPVPAALVVDRVPPVLGGVSSELGVCPHEARDTGDQGAEGTA